MPNGGHVCCDGCACNDPTRGRCEVFGIETGTEAAFMVCRMYRAGHETHEESRRSHPMLKRLRRGTVYAIDNTHGVDAAPRPIYHVTPVG